MKKNKKKENKKPEIHDDGRTIVDMNVEGFSWYEPNRNRKSKKEKDRDAPTKRETLAMIFAAYRAYLPYFLILIGGFTLALIIVLIWLH